MNQKMKQKKTSKYRRSSYF